MSYGLEQTIPIGDLAEGPHEIEAEFVAADHGSFDPPVTATVDLREGVAVRRDVRIGARGAAGRGQASPSGPVPHWRMPASSRATRQTAPSSTPRPTRSS